MTAAQVQHLLCFLGYELGTADGIWGAQSKKALARFQQDYGGIAVDGVPGPETQKALRHAVAYGLPQRAANRFWEEITHFSRKEFACKCGSCGGFPVEPQKRLVCIAEEMRKHFGRPITVSSGVRCAAHNAAVGGVSNSRHLSGNAMDFSVSRHSADQVLRYLETLRDVRYAYAIDSEYVHMDIP